jgi:Right handed beta helix region
MKRHIQRTVIIALLFVLSLTMSSCFTQVGQYPRGVRRSPNRPPETETPSAEYNPSTTLTAIVESRNPADPAFPEITLRFTDVRTAFLALRDSALAGHEAERYELLIEPGTYRIRRSMTWIEDKESSVWREFAMHPTIDGEVIISGAEINREGDADRQWNDLNEWETVDASLYRYATEWPYSFGMVDINKFSDNYQRWINDCDRPEILKRREMVLVNGSILQQRLENEKLLPGTFKVFESEANEPGRLAIQLTEPLKAGDQIQIPITQNLLILRNLDRIEITNIDFVHANPHHGTKAVIISGAPSIQLTYCSFNEHNWKGLGIGNTPLPTDYSRPDTLEIINCQANRNGGMGMGLSFLTRLRVENCELAENSWRSWAAGTDAWAVGGCKLFHVHDVTVTGMNAHDNLSTGLWFDTDGERIVVENSLFVDNARDGLFIEACQGPVDVVNNRLLNNGRDGLRSNSSSFLTVQNCRFELNKAAHFCLAGTSRKFTSFSSDVAMHVQAKNNLFRDNQFLGEPIWYVEEWLVPKGKRYYENETRFVNNSSWPYDRNNSFSQKPLPEDQR